MRAGLGQGDLLDIPRPYGGEPISNSGMWDPVQAVMPLLKPFQVSILPPEQRLFGVNANTILTLGIGVLVVGVILSMVRR